MKRAHGSYGAGEKATEGSSAHSLEADRNVCVTGTHVPGGLQPDLIAEAISWRHHLHRHPELAYNEHWTADFIASQLSQCGLTVHSGLGGTGVVGTLTCGTSGRAIAIRADMDALLLHEEGDAPHVSLIPGIMHACGHDGHVAMLLAAARHLACSKCFNGTVHFIFQTADEGHEGARRMIDDGLFRLFPCEAVYALHNWPGLALGTVAVQPDPVWAASDKFEITLEAIGDHAAMPHLTPDAILAACHLVSQINTIVTRRIPPKSALLSLTQIHGGRTYNVPPPRVTVAGTVTSFDPSVQDTIETALRQIAEGVAQETGIKAKIGYNRRCAATVNDPEVARFARTVASAPPLNLRVVDAAPSLLLAADFSFMPRDVRSCYLWLGAAKSGENLGLHSPRYDFNDAVLPVGVALWVSLVRRSLRST